MVSSNWTHECKAKTMMKINTNRRTNTQQVYKHKLKKKKEANKEKRLNKYCSYRKEEKEILN